MLLPLKHPTASGSPPFLLEVRVSPTSLGGAPPRFPCTHPSPRCSLRGPAGRSPGPSPRAWTAGLPAPQVSRAGLGGLLQVAARGPRSVTPPLPPARSPKGKAGAPGLVEQTLGPRGEHAAIAAAAAAARRGSPAASGSRHVPYHVGAAAANGLWWNLSHGGGAVSAPAAGPGGFLVALVGCGPRNFGTPGPQDPRTSAPWDSELPGPMTREPRHPGTLRP